MESFQDVSDRLDGHSFRCAQAQTKQVCGYFHFERFRSQSRAEKNELLIRKVHTESVLEIG
jgi:hypothetical protein